MQNYWLMAYYNGEWQLQFGISERLRRLYYEVKKTGWVENRMQETRRLADSLSEISYCCM